MQDFILSLSTVIEADESIPAIHSAADILRRDLRDTLTGHGPANTIRVVLDPALDEEQYTAHVEEHELRLRCGNDLGAVYALLSISDKWLSAAHRLAGIWP